MNNSIQMGRYILFLAILALPFFFAPVSESAALTIDADRQFQFAESYFSKGEYFLAIGEYKRFIYFFPQDQRIEKARFQIGMSFFQSERFQDAIASFKNLLDIHQNTDLSLKSHFMISQCYLELKDHGRALATLFNLIRMTGEVNTQDEAYYKIGWIYLEVAAWEKADLYFGKISPANQRNYQLKRLSDALSKKNLIPKKDPRLAGFLSIIPGAGYFYLERYQDALIAFLLNTGFGFAAYESFNDDNYGLGGLFTFVGMGFYSGNIYGAISSAHKYNRNQNEQFIKKLKDNVRIDISAEPRTRGIRLSFNYTF
ncbi:MAG: tetratricopeptide repeat protein [Desulfobacterales bacterium]|nr:tetratricopeptide repeat protein [Desulfobacterales bacterium]